MKKRIIVCCDGTWQNSDNGLVKTSLTQPVPTLQIPSNITRISRAFTQTCADGTVQIIYYQSGVGSRTGIVDRIAGGAFGIGIAENIREAYSYICSNYVDGDEIILVGFSRGAFTARSIAGMISDLGLLTREGMEFFYPVFKDMQNWMDNNYDDPFPNLPFSNKPKGSNAADIYRTRLLDKRYTRVRQNGEKGNLIHVRAIGVWDTVGSLGIPEIPWLSKLGVTRTTREFSWYDTNLSPKIDHAFQALAIDESRSAFSPAVWERLPGQTTDLRQVWFPGNHGNIGGGWDDEGVANMTLAWMMDQLASVGVEFTPRVLDKLFNHNVDYYKSLNKQDGGNTSSGFLGLGKSVSKPWATEQIYEANKPERPWALHKIQSANNAFYDILGKIPRSPGLYKKVNPQNGQSTNTFLEDTNERIHSSVRVRLSCRGLSVDDKEVWKCQPLLGLWRIRQVTDPFQDPIPKDATWGPLESGTDEVEPVQARVGDSRWIWEYTGPEKTAPVIRTMVEDNLGPYEQYLLKLSSGKDPLVLEYAEGKAADFSSL